MAARGSVRQPSKGESKVAQKRALIMAGGEGRRLRPLTIGMPKPLLQIGDRPILEHILLRLRGFGVEHVTLAVAYLASMIESYFGSGERYGMRISYLHEDTPLGTAGALRCLPDFDAPVLMMNGDILTDINFLAMEEQHWAHRAVVTVASKTMYTNLSMGVLDVDDSGGVVSYQEKPRLAHRFSLGLYVVDPLVQSYIQVGERVDMPTLISRLIESRRTVFAYDHLGRWIDIGSPNDYARANEEMMESNGIANLMMGGSSCPSGIASVTR